MGQNNILLGLMEAPRVTVWLISYLCISVDRVRFPQVNFCLLTGFLHRRLGSIPVLIKDSLEGVTCFRLYWFGNVLILTQLWVCLWHYVNVT